MREHSGNSMWWSFTTIVFILSWSVIAIVSMAAAGTAGRRPASDVPPPARDAQGQTSPAALYAQSKWVEPGDLGATETDAPDVCVGLMSIEGKVLLPVDDDR